MHYISVYFNNLFNSALAGNFYLFYENYLTVVTFPLVCCRVFYYGDLSFILTRLHVCRGSE